MSDLLHAQGVKVQEIHKIILKAGLNVVVKGIFLPSPIIEPGSLSYH
jgi:hypothetical protein